MQTAPIKLVTIVAERILEERLIADIKRLGARGYTVFVVRGEGAHGVRESDLAEGRNIRIETLVSPETADHILAHLEERYFPDYAIVAYLQNVAVVRQEKYL